MARNKRPNVKTTGTARSLNPKSTATTLVVPSLTPWPEPTVTPPKPVLGAIEDRRLHHPDKPHQWPKTVRGRPAVVTTVNKLRKAADWGNVPKKLSRARQYAKNRFGEAAYSQTKGIRAFAVPAETIVCIRRKTRRQVLAAKRRLGGGNRKPHRLSWTSKISCR